MPTNFSLDYSLMNNAISALEKARDDYASINSQLGIVRDALRDRDFVGETGNALNEYILILETKLTQLNRRCQFLRDGLSLALRDFQNIDNRLVSGQQQMGKE
jgi:hypothetical protein